ncbi:PREDICTED: uncharacterized protein LOC108965481 [Bactrocera latifrons]|uniref:uncharacterized protein LOC108965481 n=1 Tax=Bactrocera latifrons TaxID=174628 RepID=UPI0008DCC803|nr:PREDICTED: uncharacterized protein LOC108965481 [Bactrocera latifrons]
MKVLHILAIVLLAAAISAFPVEEGRENGENGWYVPQVDGSFVWMTIEEGENAIAEREKQDTLEGRLNLVPNVDIHPVKKVSGNFQFPLSALVYMEDRLGAGILAAIPANELKNSFDVLLLATT